MAFARRIRLLQHLYRRRHRVGVVLLAVFTFWLTPALGQCLMAATTQSALAGTAMADMDDHSNMASTVPCADCAVGSDSRALDGTAAIIPADPKLWSVLALVLVSVLLTINPLKSVPIPPLPLLPKRPRALKFYALRI